MVCPLLLPHGKTARTGLLFGVLFSFAGPFVFSHNHQTFPARLGFARFEDFNAVPLCLVKASQYIRDHSRSDAIIQDSENDPGFIVTALSERQNFAGKIMFGGKSPAHQERLDKLLGFKGLTDVDEVRSYAMRYNISWYLLHADSQMSWPVSILEKPAFFCDGYRVYHFKN